MGDDDASVMLLTCVDDPSDAAAPDRVLQQGGPAPILLQQGHLAAIGADLRAVTVPARPGRADVDPLLAGPVRRLVVAGTDADLAAVLVRLLRRDRLDVELAYVPADRRSAAARLWGLPHGPAAVELARTGVAQPAPLVRDDSGGVLVGRGEVRGATGSVHGEAYCDGLLVLRGSARRLVVTPWADAAPSSGGIAEPTPPGRRRAGEPVGRPPRRPRAPGAAGRPRGPGRGRRARRPGRLPARHRRPRRRGAPPAGHPLGLVPARRRLAARAGT